MKNFSSYFASGPASDSARRQKNPLNVTHW